MELKAKPVDLSYHYPMLEFWWGKRNFPPANPRFLPPTGLVIYADGKAVCAGFLFKTDAKAAIIGNLVSDPSCDSKVRSEAVEYLILSLLDRAKELGFEMAACSTNLPQLMSRYESLGFIKTDENVAHFGRAL